MNITLDLPEALVAKLNTYLEKHPQASLATLIEAALSLRPLPEKPEALLELAGIVKEAPYAAANYTAEDR